MSSKYNQQLHYNTITIPIFFKYPLIVDYLLKQNYIRNTCNFNFLVSLSILPQLSSVYNFFAAIELLSVPDSSSYLFNFLSNQGIPESIPYTA